LLNFRKIIQEAKSYEQFFVIRDADKKIVNIHQFKVSSMLIDSLPEEMKGRLRSVIKLQFNTKLKKDSSIPADPFNKEKVTYTKITELKQFPDIVEEDAFQFKYKKSSSTPAIDCSPISDWILQVPFVSMISSSLSHNFDTPTDSPVKKARTSNDL
jgi:hypothetical protein